MPLYINRKNGVRQEMTVEQYNKLSTSIKGRYRLATDSEKAAKPSTQPVKENKTGKDKPA